MFVDSSKKLEVNIIKIIKLSWMEFINALLKIRITYAVSSMWVGAAKFKFSFNILIKPLLFKRLSQLLK